MLYYSLRNILYIVNVLFEFNSFNQYWIVISSLTIFMWYFQTSPSLNNIHELVHCFTLNILLKSLQCICSLCFASW